MMSNTIQDCSVDHISVCICTFKRPDMLANALDGIVAQVSDAAFTYEVVVVDNDSYRTAEDTVHRFQSHDVLKIIYACEPEQNIALARNMAIQYATGNYIAFLDDDECPVNDWLIRLYHTMKTYKAAGILGPVLPYYPPESPEWLIKGNIFDRRRFPTGNSLTVRDTRTGNVLLARCIKEGHTWFDPAFGRTGGEDVNFFSKKIAEGHVFVWCDEAVVYETIPPERCKTTFHLKKFFRIGTLNGERLRRNSIATGLMGFVKTIAPVPIWFVLLLCSFPFGKHKWIRPVLKLTYSISCILAYCGLSLLRHRD